MLLIAIIAAMLFTTGLFVTAVLNVLITEKRRSQAYIRKVEARIDKIAQANLTEEQRRAQNKRRQQIIRDNERAFALYGA